MADSSGDAIAAIAREHYPSVLVTPSEPAYGRRLLATRSFQPGDLIFSETPILHTSHPIARSFEPSRVLDIPPDWQRLLHLYAHLMRTCAPSDVERIRIDIAMNELSAAGVVSESSRDADPEREPEYRRWAAEWVKRYKENRKKRRKQKGSGSASALALESDGNGTREWVPSTDEIFRLLALLETNSHSRDEDDMADLHDPRLPPPSSTASPETRMRADLDMDMEEASGKDEACGLWLVASMINHSCVPNCTVDIPSTRTLPVTVGHATSSSSAQSSSSSAKPVLMEPILHLRCIRPISVNQEITISYHDEEFLPTRDRQDILRSRGFQCTCELCRGTLPDRARAAVCPACLGAGAGEEGACHPQGNSDGEEEVWVCDRCSSRLTSVQASLVVQQEEAWMAQWPAILAMVDSDRPEPPFPPFVMLRALATHLPRFDSSDEDALSFPSVLPLSRALRHELGALHLTHSHFYTFLKFILFEQSVWLRRQLGDDGVSGILLAMVAIVERNIADEKASKVSEERRVLGYWMAKEVRTRLDGASDEESMRFWTQVQEAGLQRWEDGMKYIYGRP